VSTESPVISLLGLITVLLRNRVLIARVIGLVALAVIVTGLLLPRSYTATASFIPQSRRSPLSTVSGFAAQFGLALPDDANQSPAFYVDLLKSREILGAVVQRSYRVPSDTGIENGTLVQLFRGAGRNDGERRESAIRRLRRLMSISAVARTGVVGFSVRARSAPLAEQISWQLLDQVNKFNLETRQSRAAAERRFTERRVEEVKGELREAEDRLQEFLQGNRDFRNSPVLLFQHDRLARDVGMKQQLYTTLAQAYEQAKIDEVRDTPVITMIERPEAPVRPDSRRLATKGFLALIVGGLLGFVLAFAREALRNTELGGSEELEQFVMLKKEALDDLRHPLRATRRILFRG